MSRLEKGTKAECGDEYMPGHTHTQKTHTYILMLACRNMQALTHSYTHIHTHTQRRVHTCTKSNAVLWQEHWLLYLSAGFSHKHPRLSLISCAKQSPYQHLAHHPALCQLGPYCQGCQPMPVAQAPFPSLCLHHGFIIISLCHIKQLWDKYCKPVHFLGTGCVVPHRAFLSPSEIKGHYVLLAAPSFYPLKWP